MSAMNYKVKIIYIIVDDNIIAILSQDDMVNLKQDVILTCVAFGNLSSTLSITWHKNNDKNITGRTRSYCMASKESRSAHYRFLHSFLQILNFQCEHEGKYTCQASNGVITTRSDVILELKGKSKNSK